MTDDAHFACVPLPTVLDAPAAAPLAALLLSLRGRAISIDASRVEKLGALCLQVLISARISWTADGVAMRIEGSSPAFRDATGLFGATTIMRRA